MSWMRRVGLKITTDCTPYLLQLGLTKSRTSLVWIAGPLSGLIMQPVVGVLADSSRSKWGRRRPFMIGGALIVGLCLVVLGWTAEIVACFITEPKLVRDHCTYMMVDETIMAMNRSDHVLSLWRCSVSTLSILRSTLVGVMRDQSEGDILRQSQFSRHAGA